MCIIKRARRIHTAINRHIFNGELPTINFRLLTGIELSGKFQGSYMGANGHEVHERIYINRKHNLTHALLFDTVAHETVHQFQHNTVGYGLGHGGDFIDKMLDIENEFGISLNVIYDY